MPIKAHGTLSLPDLALELNAVDILGPAMTLKPGCGEVLWCNHSSLLQQRIYQWQNPSKDICDTRAKYLIYDPLNYGIGSMVHIAATALSLAICTGRILYLPYKSSPNNRAWAPADCKSTTLSCYFKDVTSCVLSPKQQEGIPELNITNWKLLADVRYVKIKDGSLPSGPCTFCTNNEQFPLFAEISEKDAYTGSEAPLMAQLVRYLLRPQPWFQRKIELFIEKQNLPLLMRPFASMHVRYGDKVSEAPRMPLASYMDILRTHRPDVRTVFLSTETASVISELIRSYPDYSFKSFNYSRIETTVAGIRGAVANNNEFIASFANLVVAIQANFFVGSLSSNWCRLIHELERTRGDGGFEYLSVDGSQYSRCFR